MNHEETIFEQALEIGSEPAREEFLHRACGGNTAMRHRLQGLLRAHDRAGKFLEHARPAEAATGVTPAAAPTTVSLPLTEKPGERIGRYKLLQKIGEGGCGVVYMAEQEEPVRRRVALKIIKLGMDTRSVIARFEVERQALALMDHPNIAKIFDGGMTETAVCSAGCQPAVSPISNRQTRESPDHPLESGNAPQAGSPAIPQTGSTGSLRYELSAGRPYFVMELVRGVKITEYCDEKKLTTHERLELFMQVCRAVQHAHQKGIIHRDLKPSNILVSVNDGVAVPKVIDFGIAKATTGEPLTDKTVFTAFEQFIGTPAYMSPEQALVTSLDIDTRSDIYSLGVLLYELLTGQTPFDPKELLQSGLDEMRCTIREQEPQRPSTRLSTLPAEALSTTAQRRGLDAPKLVSQLRGDLDWIVMKCLEKDRARRYETANGLARDIERHLNNEPVLARPPTKAYRLQKMVRRNRVVVTALCAVLSALLIGFGVATWMFIKERQATRRATVNEGRAEAAAIHSRTTLANSDFQQAIRLISDGNRTEALAYLVRSLSLHPERDAALTRLISLLTYHSWPIPTLILKHEGPINTAQFSSDGKWLVTASEDHSARVWDAATGQSMVELRHGDTVTRARFSLDGTRIVTSSWDRTARVWDARSGQPLTGPLIHGGKVRAEFSADGKRIATASADHTARI
jgi:serine/threonine protein kinase